MQTRLGVILTWVAVLTGALSPVSGASTCLASLNIRTTYTQTHTRYTHTHARASTRAETAGAPVTARATEKGALLQCGGCKGSSPAKPHGGVRTEDRDDGAQSAPTACLHGDSGVLLHVTLFAAVGARALATRYRQTGASTALPFA